jgi:hypothetical protein
MKIRTNILAGMTFAECDAQRSWWKQQAQLMEQYANNVNAGPPSGLWLASGGTSVPPATGSGGYVGGVYYPDKSGVCGGSVPPPTTPKPPTTTGGGYVGGVYFPDKSGVCGCFKRPTMNVKPTSKQATWSTR